MPQPAALSFYKSIGMCEPVLGLLGGADALAIVGCQDAKALQSSWKDSKEPHEVEICGVNACRVNTLSFFYLQRPPEHVAST